MEGRPEGGDTTQALDEPLLDVLIEAKLVTPEAADQARTMRSETGLTLTDAVLAQRLLPENALLAFFGRRHQARFVTARKLADASIHASLADRLPVRACEAYGCLPIWWSAATETLTVLFAIPVDQPRVDAVRRLTDAKQLVTCVATWTAVRAGIKRLYYADRSAFDDLDEYGAAPPPRRPVTRESLSEQTRILYRSDREMMVSLRQENARFRIAQEFHRRVPLERTVERQLQAILSLLLDIISADTAAIQLVSGLQARRSPAGLPEQPLPSTLIARAMDSECGIVLTDPELADLRTGSVVQRGVRSALVMPLRSREKPVGVIYLESVSAPAAFDRDDQALLAALASQAATAIHNAELIGVVESETAARAHLARFLAPELVESAVAGALDRHLQTRSAVVTVVFVDIRGFTQLCSNASADDVVELLGRFYDEMSQAVFAEGGMVDKFMGDGVMAIWGAPVPHPDHARRALRAALSMLERAANISLSGQALQLGVGVATGEVILGTVGGGRRLDYTAVGSTVNLAARLCDRAAAGEIVASDSTVKGAGEGVAADPQGPISIKGLDVPTPVHRVTALSETAAPDAPESTLDTTQPTPSSNATPHE